MDMSTLAHLMASESIHSEAVAAAPARAAQLRKIFTTDADTHAGSLDQWQQNYDQISAGRFFGVVREISLGDMHLFRETTNQALLQRGRTPSSGGVIGVPVGMLADGFFCDQILGSNGVLTVGQKQDFELRTPRCFDLVGIDIDADLYRALVAPRAMAATPEWKIVPRVITCNERLNDLRKLLVDIFEALDMDAHRLEAPQTQKVIRSAIIGHLQESVAIEGCGPGMLPNLATRRRIVERARDYTLDNLHDPVTIGELCDHLGISRRTLQYCFQEVMGTNPVDFLRAIRLNNVRRELRAAKPGAVRIADVAARWGFWHLSHFARDYKVMFDELPSDTLSYHSAKTKSCSG